MFKYWNIACKNVLLGSTLTLIWESNIRGRISGKAGAGKILMSLFLEVSVSVTYNSL